MHSVVAEMDIVIRCQNCEVYCNLKVCKQRQPLHYAWHASRDQNDILFKPNQCPLVAMDELVTSASLHKLVKGTLTE